VVAGAALAHARFVFRTRRALWHSSVNALALLLRPGRIEDCLSRGGEIGRRWAGETPV
jgi:hypothetical protein